MRIFVREGEGRVQVNRMTVPQSKQAAAIMDCFGRLIPQEGVDYDVEITFKGANNPSVSMNIVPHTDKGEWWKNYAMEMIKKYPPTVKNPEPCLPEEHQQEHADGQEEAHAEELS